jgi:hypothetical protein
MSKRVEVREGDKWLLRGTALNQVRDNTKMRMVAHTNTASVCATINNWYAYIPHNAENEMNPAIAKAIVIACGGEWAEVAEEKPATTTTKTLHLYAGPSTPASVFMYDGKLEQVSPGMKYLGTATFTIAGVTT